MNAHDHIGNWQSHTDSTATHRPRAHPSAQPRRYVGIDIGSVSLNVAVIDADGHVVAGVYERTHGQPLPRLYDALRRLNAEVSEAVLYGTGSGRPLLADLLCLPVENEIVAHAWGGAHFHPEARTIIEIGGQDSKLILLEGRAANGSPIIADHAMNEICAAGTGSFLDQQAARLGVLIEEEFGALALRSERPPAIAGRCSVFAKSDMIHLQQEGYPKEDIIAGLCYALARNYLSNLGRGRRLRPPVLFQGGVAANQGVAKAFEDLLGLEPGQLIIPEHHSLMGAIGAALMARAQGIEPVPLAALIAALEIQLDRHHDQGAALPRLRPQQARPRQPARPDEAGWGGLFAAPDDVDEAPAAPSPSTPLYLGIDVGSVSTNVVLVDGSGDVQGELYLYTEGDPIETVRHALSALGDSWATPPAIAAVGVTGSGRYLIGDFVGADTVVNEITAQARAAIAIDPEADTVFEIGGQDSKFIRLRDGAVVDFEMNKVCAAGTGAFLAEQATRLEVQIEDEFSRLAFEAEAPVDLGSRCTVFMESDLIHHQQQGTERRGLVAGLAYAIARNYLEKVVGHKAIGERILFQGGVAANPSVVAAFENLVGRPITVPPHHRSTGAIGAALLARGAMRAGSEIPTSHFRGFDLSERSYHTESFQCQACANRCDIKKVVLDNETHSFYGSICGKFDTRAVDDVQLDLFAEREAMLLDGWLPDGPAPDAPTVGIPRVLLYHELFPEWCAYFQSLGYRVVLSDPTNRHIINQGLEHVVVEVCFPVKVAYGHVVDLIHKGVDRIFLPAIVERPRPNNPKHKNYNCPFVQNINAFVRAAFPDATIHHPSITCAARQSNWRQAMAGLAAELGHAPDQAGRALDAAEAAQQRFEARLARRGREVLDHLDPAVPAVVLFGRSYNTCDHALNLQVARKLHQRGALPIPLDFLPIHDVAPDPAWEDVVWKIGQDFVAAATLVRADPRLHPIVITNFSCGPDSLLLANIVEPLFTDRPFLALEVDEHFAGAGVVTRCEAFLHELRARRTPVATTPFQPRPVHVLTRKHRHMDRTVYIPSDSEQFYAVWAAFRSIGVEAELLSHQPVWGSSGPAGLRAQLLPPPDRHTEELGRHHTLSRGCLPFIHFAGDAVRMTEIPGFDPARAAFVIPGNDESCRVNQFPRGLRHILDRLGAEESIIITPRVSLEADEAFTFFGPTFERTLWLGLVTIDLLYRKRFETRPYELNPGDTDAAFHRHIRTVAEAIGRPNFLDTVRDALQAMDSVQTSTRGIRPQIALIGDRYMMVNSFLNNDLVRDIEALGGEVWLTPYLTDYLRAQGYLYPKMLRKMGRYAAAVLHTIRHVVQMRDYNRLEALFAPFLINKYEPTIPQIIEYASPYFAPDMEIPIVGNVAKCVDFARKGCAGLINLVPLGCLLANAYAACFPKLRADYGNIPILNLIFDGLKATNQRTRLQAFMHQVGASVRSRGRTVAVPS